MPEESPNIIAYNDYRLYLNDLYLRRKHSRAGYSWRRFAADLGLNPSNYLHLVVTGKRNLSREALDTIEPRLPAGAQQRKFFHHLVLLNQAGNDADKTLHRGELDGILGKKSRVIPRDQLAYFGTWYIPVIREVIALQDFVSSVVWISRKLVPSVAPSLVKEALKTLARLGLIVVRNGRWAQSEAHLATPPEIASELVHNYHKEILKLSMHALDLPASMRDVSAMTMGISAGQFGRLKQRLRDFRAELQQELDAEKEPPELVAQLNIQFFPVTNGKTS